MIRRIAISAAVLASIAALWLALGAFPRDEVRDATALFFTDLDTIPALHSGR